MQRKQKERIKNHKNIFLLNAKQHDSLKAKAIFRKSF